jgi:hypothetical protein
MWTLLAVANAALLDVCPAGCTRQTVQGAVDLAAPGDVLDVAAGFYPEAVEVTLPITLRGDGAGRTIRDGGNAGAVRLSPIPATIDRPLLRVDVPDAGRPRD